VREVDVDANLFRGVLAAHTGDVQLDPRAVALFVTAVTWRRFGIIGCARRRMSTSGVGSPTVREGDDLVLPEELIDDVLGALAL